MLSTPIRIEQMWILEGHIFRGKTIWLKPETRYIFGRTREDGGGQFIILDGTVSRKHSIIEVAPIDDAAIRSPPQVTITDLDSTYGAFLDGEQINGKARLLNTYHIVQLGRCEHHFRISWVTVPSHYPFVIKEQIHGRRTSLYRRVTHPDNRASKRHERRVNKHFFAKKCKIFIVLEQLPDGIVAVKKVVVTVKMEAPLPHIRNFAANFP